MQSVKDAVSPWVKGMPAAARQGRDRSVDLAQLGEAVDQLRTGAPMECSEKLQRQISLSADKLDIQFQALGENNKAEEHWKSAHSEIQLILPRLEQAERKMRDDQIAPQDDGVSFS